MKKLERIQAIQEILSRWGKLDKNSIDQRLASKFSEELTSALKRAIYRDLEALVNQGRLNVEYYDSEGILIEDYDSKIHKNTTCKWAVVGQENQIIGEKYLNEVFSSLYCPSVLRDDISLHDGGVDTTFKTRHLFFVINGKFLCLKVNLEAVPVKLIVSRNKEVLNFKKDQDAFVEKFGKRAIHLRVPFNKISSFDGDKKLGHIELSINEDNIELNDLNSANGSKYFRITMQAADEIRANGAMLGTDTLSFNWGGLMSREVVESVEVKNDKLDAPFVLSLADEFLVLIL